jgi:hypothetical protein
MNIDLTASNDAGQTKHHCDFANIILNNGSADALSSSKRSLWSKWFRGRLIGTVLGLFVVLDPTSGGIGVAVASQDSSLWSFVVTVLPAEPAFDNIVITEPQARRTDPLERIGIPFGADVRDLGASIISGMAATKPSNDIVIDDDVAVSEAYLAFGDHRVPLWIVDAITRGAEASGADPVYMMALADKESSFIPYNKAGTSSAEGLFQFITGTWLEAIRSFGAKHGYEAEAAAISTVDGQLDVADEKMREHILGLRRNPYVSALMAGELKIRDTATLEEKLGRKISRSEFYLSHFFGVDRARRFMRLVDAKPKQSASRVFPAAAKANKALFFAKAGRKIRQLTVGEVYEKIDAMIDTRLQRYEGVLDLRVADVAL